MMRKYNIFVKILLIFINFTFFQRKLLNTLRMNELIAIAEDDEDIGDDFENLYKGEISKSGVPILPSKRARKIPEKIQVSKEDLAELTNAPEVSVEDNENEDEDVSLDQMTDKENSEASVDESESSNS